MKRGLGWQRVTREALADHLRQADILASEALGDTSVYRCKDGDGESIAVSLAGNDGAEGLIIRLRVERPVPLERRRKTAPPAPRR